MDSLEYGLTMQKEINRIGGLPFKVASDLLWMYVKESEENKRLQIQLLYALSNGEYLTTDMITDEMINEVFNKMT